MRTAFRPSPAGRLSGLAILAVLACDPGPAGAIDPLADWDDFDTLMDVTVANRPDVIYPPGGLAFTHGIGLRTFDAAGFPGLTNTPHHRTLGDVPVWNLLTVETNGWFVAASAGTAVHSNAVAAYDAEAWARAKYGAPQAWISADPDRLAEWYLLRRRDRVAMSLSLVPADRWDDYLDALADACTNGPPPGVPGPVAPADTNRVAFARVAEGTGGTFDFELYTPGDLPVDVFRRGALPATSLWDYAGTVQAVAPFTPSAVAQTPGPQFLFAARADVDADGDGLPDGLEELALGTRADLWDSDGDGLPDRAEIYRYGLEPLYRDTDGDGYDDDEELRAATDPTQATAGAGAASIRYYRDEDDRLVAAHAGAGGGAATAAPTPAGNPAALQERSAP